MMFRGRYFVNCGKVVQVHPDGNGASKGHVICTEAPWSNDLILGWDERGNCTRLLSTSGVPMKLGDWDIDCIVSPQSTIAGIEVVDCEDCRNENRERREGKRDSTALSNLVRSTVSDTERLDWLLDYVNTLCTNKMQRMDIDKELAK